MFSPDASVLALIVLLSGGASHLHPTREPIKIALVEAGSPSAETLAEGAKVALAEANARGGVGGRHLRLVQIPPPRHWQDAAFLTARVLAEEDVVALIGPTDGTAAHAVAQIATKRRIPLITLSSEKSLTQAMDPWVFRAVPDDEAQAKALLRRAFVHPRGKKASLAVPRGRRGRVARASLEKACRDLEVTVVSVHTTGERAPPRDSDVLLLWLDPVEASKLLKEWEPEDAPRRVLGHMWLDDPGFLTQIPKWGGRLLLPRLIGDPPHDLAPSDGGAVGSSLHWALGYDAALAIVTAARRSGAEPRLIREGLARGNFIAGQSGAFHFDPKGNRKGSVPVGAVRRNELGRSPLEVSPEGEQRGGEREAHRPKEGKT